MKSNTHDGWFVRQHNAARSWPGTQEAIGKGLRTRTIASFEKKV